MCSQVSSEGIGAQSGHASGGSQGMHRAADGRVRADSADCWDTAVESEVQVCPYRRRVDCLRLMGPLEKAQSTLIVCSRNSPPTEQRRR